MSDLRVLVVDDEAPARCRIEDLVSRSAGARVIASCADGHEAIEAILNGGLDLVFLDVQMPELDGLEVIRAIGAERMPAVVFVTAHDEYAIDAFESAALDYLLKPFSDERFAQALARAREQVELRRAGALGEQLLSRLASAAAPAFASRLAVRDGEAVRIIAVAAIDYVQARGPYLEIYLSGRSLLYRERMHALEARLDPAIFCRVHRSTIVNLDRVSVLHPEASGDCLVELGCGTQLKVSRSRVAVLQQRLGLL